MTARFTVIPAVYVIFRDGEKVLLTRRTNTGYMDGYYGLPSGHVDGNESAVRAAAREAKEEVGVTISENDLTFVHVMHRVAEKGDHERVDFYFEATRWLGDPTNAEPHKCDDVQWFPINDLPENMVPVVRTALGHIADGEYYSDDNF